MRRPPSKAEKAFATKIRNLRGEESQVKFAKRLGISQSTLNRIENCEQSVTLYLIEKIAGRLHLRLQSFFE
jgi:transcriptional regulator with XRE-family HTH domain